MIPLPNGYAAVIVPEGMKKYVLHKGQIIPLVNRHFKSPITIPDGWSIIGLAKEISEEEWREIVERANPGYIDYTPIRKEKDMIERVVYGWLTAKGSGLSLLASLSLKQNCLILKKK